MRGSTSGLPRGTVTFVFTDIEGSTLLVQKLGDGYPSVLADHNQLIRATLSHHGGVEVSTEGDSFFAVFSSAAKAIAAVAEIQRNVAEHAWPADGEVRVRIGVHTGTGSLVEGGNYVGLDVHRAARISGAGHGGQVVVSESTASVLGSDLPAGLRLVDLGKHRLKDLTDPETLHQLNIPGLDAEFPPLKTLEAIPNNLPVQITSFVGRADAMTQARDLLEENRILTLTGPGGTGKTRLSLQLAAEASTEFDDGVFFVPLAPISNPDLVASAVLDALELAPTSPGKDPDGHLVDQVRSRTVLLLLDNFEHVIEASPLVSRLAKASPRSKFLVTSRIPLGVGGEQEMPVPPLKTGETGKGLDVSALMEVEGIRLFVERALSVRPDFELNPDNATAVVRLVNQLDGLPLAIELVASQVKMLSPDAILERLDLKTLRSARRDLPERQSTLWGAIKWSHQLLDGPERQLFARLSVFAGGARLCQIEEVCTSGLDVDLLTCLATLVDHNLVQSPRGDETRFHMLHVVREFATSQLEESSEATELRRSHAAAYASLTEKTAPELVGKNRKKWLDRLGEDIDNIRDALTWAIDTGRTDLASRLAFNTWRFWQARGYLHEAESWIEQILDLPAQSPFWRAKALEAAGGIAWWRGDIATTREMYAGALDFQRKGDDRTELANALYNVGLATPNLHGSGPGGSQRRDQAEAEAISHAFRLFDEAEQIYAEAGDIGGMADVTWGRGSIRLLENDHEGHLADALKAAEMYGKTGNEYGMGWALFMAGLAHHELGNPEESTQFLSEALDKFYDQEDVSAVILHLSALASVAKERDDMPRAVTLAGAIHKLSLESGSENVVEGLEYETLEEMTGNLGTAYERGKGMDMSAAVAYALSEND